MNEIVVGSRPCRRGRNQPWRAAARGAGAVGGHGADPRRRDRRGDEIPPARGQFAARAPRRPQGVRACSPRSPYGCSPSTWSKSLSSPSSTYAVGAVDDVEAALYFSITAYSTLGQSDLEFPGEWRHPRRHRRPGRLPVDRLVDRGLLCRHEQIAARKGAPAATPPTPDYRAARPRPLPHRTIRRKSAA